LIGKPAQAALYACHDKAVKTLNREWPELQPRGAEEYVPNRNHAETTTEPGRSFNCNFFL